MDKSFSQIIPKIEHGTKVTWDREIVYKLIALVKAHPEIWDCTLKAYKNKNRKRRVHESIAETLNVTVDAVEKKIHNLRCQLNTEIRKFKRKSASGTNQICNSTWEYFESLKFMSSSARECVYNVDSHSQSEYVNDESFQQQQSENEVLVESCSPVIKSNKEKRKGRSPSEHKEDIIINETMANFRAPKDEFDIFGEFVATELRCIRSDENRRKLKRKIQKAILDVAEEDDM